MLSSKNNVMEILWYIYANGDAWVGLWRQQITDFRILTPSSTILDNIWICHRECESTS